MVVPSASVHQLLEWELQPAEQLLLVLIPGRPAFGPTMRYCENIKHKCIVNCIFLPSYKFIHYTTISTYEKKLIAPTLTKLLINTTYHFPQICGFLQGTKLEWIDDQRVPYASKGGEWVGFDTRESYEIKVLWM